MKIKAILLLVFVLLLISISSVQANETASPNINTEQNNQINDINQENIKYIVNNNEIEKKNANLTLNEIVTGANNLTIVMNLNNNASGNITIQLKNGFLSYNENKTASVINGRSILTFTDLQAYVSYNFDAYYSGDNNYNSSYFKNPSNDSFIIKELSSNIAAENVKMYYNNGSRLKVTILNSKGLPINNMGQPLYGALLPVYITIDKSNFTLYMDSNATVFLSIIFDPGDYIANIRFSSLIYPESNLAVNITVLPILFGENLTKFYKNESQYQVKLLDDKGNPLKNADVRMKINGVFYNRITDENGFATLNINLNPGEYTIIVAPPKIKNSDNSSIRLSVIYPDGFDSSYKITNKIIVLPILSGENINMSTFDRKQYEIKLLDDKGNSLANKIISININGVKYDRITDEEGIARLNINLDSGHYIATATYNDYSISNLIYVIYNIIGKTIDIMNYANYG